MRRAGALACAAGSIALALAPPASPAAAQGARQRLVVYEQEWSVWPSRPALAGGVVSVQVWNRGQDPHDLRIRRLGQAAQPAGAGQRGPVVASGAIATVSWRLAPGVYELYCALPGHRRLGMRTRLTVR